MMGMIKFCLVGCSSSSSIFQGVGLLCVCHLHVILKCCGMGYGDGTRVVVHGKIIEW